MVSTLTKIGQSRLETNYSKMFESERNEQHQTVLCNEARRFQNDTMKQLAVRVEILVQKAYSLII